MVDLNKDNIIKITGVFVLIILLGVYTYGVSVPFESPFVKLEIRSEKDVYNLGENSKQEFLVRNQMPFPVKLTFTKNITINYLILENTTQAGTIWERWEDKVIRIDAFGDYELMLAGPTLDDPYTLMFILNVEDLQETRIVHISDLTD